MFSATELSSDYRCSKHRCCLLGPAFVLTRYMSLSRYGTHPCPKLPGLKSLQAFFRRLIKIYVVYLLALV